MLRASIGATGPLAPDNSAPLKGLFYGGGMKVLEAQIIGSAIITIATFGGRDGGDVRGQRDGSAARLERRRADGLDLHEHGISAYPEYVITTLGSPAGAPIDK